jgi:TatD DNase family protein
VQFAATHDSSWAVVGVHPHESKMGYAMVEQLLRDSRGNDRSNIVGIGEIGLDYYYDHSPRDDQIRALEAQLQLSIDYNLPVSFHIRDAFDDFWPIFDNFHGIRGVMHSFTDNQANLERGFGRGLLVGVNGISTFTRDEPQVQMYATIPLDRMLLETDAPFLTPKPFRGKMNEVGYVEFVARWQSEQRQLSLEDVASVTVHNTRVLFNI